VSCAGKRPQRGFVQESGKDETSPDRIADEARTIMDPEFSHNSTSMRLDRVEADPHDVGDLLCRFTFGDQLQDFALPRGEIVGGQTYPGLALSLGGFNANAPVVRPSGYGFDGL